MEKWYLFKKDTLLKRLCYFKWKAWYKLFSSSGLKKYCIRFYHAPNILLRCMKYGGSKRLCSNARVFISLWRKINWHVLQIVKARFRHTIWFMISEKTMTKCAFIHRGDGHMHQKSHQKRLTKNLCSRISNSFNPQKLPSYGLVIFIDMNMYLFTEGRNFNTFLKENYAIALDVCYFTKQMLNIEVNMILIVLMEFAYIDIAELYSRFDVFLAI